MREHHPDVTVLLMSGYSATTVPAGEAELIGRDPRELMEARAPPILRTELMPKLLSSELSVARTTAVMLRPDGTRVQRTTSSRR